ncbi:fluoride efflux transporter CrcB [Wenzhouxiangella sp. AB-CW3]|uniref:fluoride efflux transporter CrcB n=1 Tax=Wenzhouxiangella sp. AB-CW3 TaxID=2771012 RepID=UPI00168B177D|nr:fluoride efflux transporter CrcB [Wenzhouxiangella sp. AB-CW3]QOC21300.1 fluoride efflux transporter CrcB [Wenzhouxiangella sp. AB-CW3]
MQDGGIQLLTIVLVAVGSALGGMARHMVGVVMDRVLPARIPGGTLLVNLSGCLVVGLLAAPLVLLESAPASSLSVWLVTGFLGSYTTVSAFSLQVLLMVREGRPGRAAIYVGVSLIGCLALAAIGLWIGRQLFL